MESILVTGSSGFIGWNLLQRPLYRWRPFDADEGFDIRNFDQLKERVKDCDAVVHLAAVSGVRQCEADASSAWSINVGGTANVAALGLPTIVASTAGAIKSDGVYGETKRQAEAIATAMGATVLRFANVYGPGMRHKPNLIPNAVSAAKSGETLTIHGDGQQTRDFVHVNDVCRAILQALENQLGGTWTVGSGQQRSVMDVLDAISSRFGRINTEFRPNASAGAVDGNYRERPLPGWKPKVGLTQGLESLV